MALKQSPRDSTCKGVAYARYSSELQDDSSIERQLQLARDWADQNGVEIVRTFADHAVSSYKTSNLDQQLGEAIRFVATHGQISHFIVEDSDRLSRESPFAAIAKLSQLWDMNLQIVLTATRTVINPRSSDDQLKVFLQQYLGHRENTKKAERLRESYERRARQNMATPRLVYGYMRKAGGEVVVDEERTAVVRRVFKMCANGHSIGSIAKTLNRERVKGPTSKKRRPKSLKGESKPTWYSNTIADMLRRKTYVDGSQTTKYGTSYPYPPIIDDELWSRVASIMNDLALPQSLEKRRASGKTGNLFTGILRCPHCGKSYAIRSKSDSQRHARFYCSSRRESACRNKFTVRVDQLEAAVLSRLHETLSTGHIASLVNDINSRNSEIHRSLAVQIRQVSEELEIEEQRIAVLVNRYADSTGSVASALEEAIGKKKDEFEKLKSTLASMRSDQKKLTDGSGNVKVLVSPVLESIQQLIRSAGKKYRFLFVVEPTDEELAILNDPKRRNGEDGFMLRRKMTEALRSHVAEQPEDELRLGLKTAISQIVDLIEIDEVGKCAIFLKSGIVENLVLEHSTCERFYS